MELEEVIERLEKLLKLRLNKANEIKYDNCIIATEDLQIILKYIKEESIPIAVVEEQIGKINELLLDIDYYDIKDKEEREYYKKEFMKYITVRNYLQGLLNKGE